jgi:hypothetical protein
MSAAAVAAAANTTAQAAETVAASVSAVEEARSAVTAARNARMSAALPKQIASSGPGVASYFPVIPTPPQPTAAAANEMSFQVTGNGARCGGGVHPGILRYVDVDGTERATENRARLQWRRFGGWVGALLDRLYCKYGFTLRT